MRIFKRLSTWDSDLWSDVTIARVPVALKRYLLANIVSVIVFQVWFDWTTHQNHYFASFTNYKSIIDGICTVILLTLMVSLFGLASFGGNLKKNDEQFGAIKL